ncbi:hypothetical protein KC19_12G171800 [Ceratodon purpureus]|uniref:DUF642 domain-containing protein n=1 Tax=Ceratodon purpureus TaxID=3225 RepID=A0A8T0GAS8_CERPU|nr:hypothetical protein KC19_12G171800 [Ceratodon purpureus]
MERCRRRLPHRHKQLCSPAACLLRPFMVLMLLLVDGADSDVVNLLRGGSFIDDSIKFAVYPVRDVLAHGSRTLLPYWTCTHGGVQLWDTQVYIPSLSDNCTFIVHMNSRVGGGHIISTPLYTPRVNAEYVVSMSLACNPHGGPRNQSLMVLVFDDNGKEMQPRPNPFVVEMDPTSSMQNLMWERRSFKMLGTGKCMYLYLASMVKGYYGLLVANVQVNLVNLVENGSFETLTLNPTDVFNSVTQDVTLDGPRLKSIPNWVVESGKVRLSTTGLGKAFQAATDGGQYMIELNAAASAGEISTMFVVPMNTSISKDHEYVLLFDTAVNPIQINPQTSSSLGNANTLVGKLGIKVVGVQTGKDLLDKTYESNSTGFTFVSVGWTTKNYTFKMGEDKTAKISFRSLTDGIDYGPFVDNVAVYEMKNKDEWIKINAPGYVPSSGANKQMLAVGVAERLLVLVMTTLLLLVFKQ